MLFSKPLRAIGIDIGSHSVKAVQMSKNGGRLRIEQAGYALVDSNQVNLDPLGAQADALREAVRSMNLNKATFVGALPGQTAVIRYPRLPDMTANDLSEAVAREASQNIPYELADVFLDWTLLDRETESEKAMLRILLVAAKREVIDSRAQIAAAADLQFTTLGVDSLALVDAAEACDMLRSGESVALLNLGATSTSIHFVKDGISNFIRDINWGAREMIQAVAKGRRCEFQEAERLLSEMTEHAGPETAAPEEPGDFLDVPLPDDEPISLAASPLDPLDDELPEAPMAAPSFRSQTPIGTAQQEQPVEALLAQPLGRLVSEIQRSFSFYEQHLYQRRVDRLILSGGAVHLPVVRDTLAVELGMEQVEVANPANGALGMNGERETMPLLQRPSQFMVAVGLAARGASEL